MTLNEELAELLLMRSDLSRIRAGKTLEEMIVWLLDDCDLCDDIDPEDRLELEFALSYRLMEIFS